MSCRFFLFCELLILRFHFFRRELFDDAHTVEIDINELITFAVKILWRVYDNLFYELVHQFRRQFFQIGDLLCL